MATLSIQIKGPCVHLRSASFNPKQWEIYADKVNQQKSGGWYNLLEDDFFLGIKSDSTDGKAILHWKDMDELSLLGVSPGKKSIMHIRHSNNKKGFRKNLNQLLEQGMLFPLFNNSIRSLGFDPLADHSVTVAESQIGPVFHFSWQVPDMEVFNPEALEFCWVKVNLYGKREFLIFTEVLYKKRSPDEVKPGKTMVKSWELILK